MAQRTTCVYKGKIIGIESIYTVVAGMQINIPEKVEELREKSRRNELFCPCGCGANLILVAGDRNLREQHFRVKDPNRESVCNYVSEGAISVNSKIVLKCWLEDKLKDDTIESRVPICAVDDTTRKYEMTFLSQKSQMAISYCHDRSSLTDEKINILESNSSDLKIHYVADIENEGNDLQYPEKMMKVQKIQGYCLFLQISGNDHNQPLYSDARLKVSFYYRNPNQYWEEIEVLQDNLSSFTFGDNGMLLHKGLPVEKLKNEKEHQHIEKLEQIKKSWEKQQQERKEAEERRRIEEEKRLMEQLEKQARMEEQARIDHQEKIRLQREAEEKRAEDAAKKERERYEALKKKIDAVIDSDQEKPYMDELGNRWVRCKYCGKVDVDSEFGSYGGIHETNLGKCKECYNQEKYTVLSKYQIKQSPVSMIKRKPYDANVCPECGASLREKNGRFGSFWGCSRYPQCKYTRHR